MTIRLQFYICRFFPAPTGATFSALRLAQALRERGATVSFLVESDESAPTADERHDGFPVHRFALQRPGKSGKLRALLRFTRHIRRERFEVFHLHGGGYVNLFLGWWVRVVTGRPTLLKITSDGWDTPEGMAAEKWGAFSLFCYRRLSGIVAMTSGQAAKCRAWKMPGHIAVIPNGVDCARYRPVSAAEKTALRQQLGLPANAFILVYVGWLGHGKGTDVLVETWQRLRSNHPEVHLLVVGDYLAARGERGTGSGFELPAAPGLHRAGRVEDAERYLQAADVFVFPSRREGFGTVQIEAMACGLPCVVNDLPGVSADIFPDDRCGFRIADNRVADFVGQIERLVADAELRARMGAAARERAVAAFSSESVADRYLAFYRTLLNPP